MELKEYYEKRDFSQTPEPSGQKAEGDKKILHFVIQKHEASRLHYDFRLEVNGVLKSWAVPKGPSMNPEDKHLAMMVEDHPMEYRTFEGIIPEGNYGAGSVMVWDEGNYLVINTKSVTESEKAFNEGLSKGHISFVLNGKKLRGEFTLTKIENDEDHEGKSWLLIKKNDEYALKDDISKEEKSVLTDRTMKEIEKNKTSQWISTKDVDLTSAPKAPFPNEVKPMLSTLVKESFDRKNWYFEIKWDGYRTIAFLNQGKVDLSSRNNISFNKKFSQIKETLETLKIQAVFDGEVVVLDNKGRANFQLLQNFNETGEGNLVYYVFDLLYLDNHDLTKLPLWRRKEILRQILPSLPNIFFSSHILEKGKNFFEAAKEQNLEGVIAKDSKSVYEQGVRSEKWLKIKSLQRQEAVIGGFTQPQGGRKKFGALVLGVYEKGEFVYVGHTGGGFDESTLSFVYEKMKPLITEKSPFALVPKTNTPATWVKPTLVCEVSFSEWTGEKNMRHPIFIGLREDKDPQLVTRELPTKAIIEKQTVSLKNEFTNLDKIYWPDDGFTKGDLVEYYQKIAPVMFPHLADRPISMHRFPNGIREKSFWQKDVEYHPSWVKTQTIRSEHEEREVNYIVCENEETITYLANLGCIEMHPWNSRLQSLDKPDYLILDLDPEDTPFTSVVKTAIQVRKFLEEAEIVSFPKTSGASGLHIYIPTQAKYSYEQVRQFAEILANLIYQRTKEFSAIVRSPKERQGKVYLDFLQNRKGQTLASAYSVRPEKGATVSAPLLWEEVDNDLHPSQFTIKNIFNRIEKYGDLWEGVLGEGVNLEKVLKNITKLSGI